jgi:hypothetical protein
VAGLDGDEVVGRAVAAGFGDESGAQAVRGVGGGIAMEDIGDGARDDA